MVVIWTGFQDYRIKSTTPSAKVVHSLFLKFCNLEILFKA